ncbi:MAG: hypothetical protein IJM81_09455 [Prevotella sp.]|nr:hypothetical protein [Prevotella sp.]
MANKKQLKSTINNVCMELISEAVAVNLYGGKQDFESVEAIITAVLKIRNDFVMRISHPEPGMPAKQYYRHLIGQFNEQASEIIDQITNFN